MFGFSYGVIISAIVGAILLWGMESDTSLEKYSFGRLTSRIPNLVVKEIVQGLLFVGLGTYVALLLTHPDTPNQAFAAGIGWTAGVNGVSSRVRRSSNKSKPSKEERVKMEAEEKTRAATK